ncbi:MAG: M20 family metallopeptidase [Gemmatimonadaceae bacterium]
MPTIAATARARHCFQEQDVQTLLALRHDLHQHPELSWKEERTAGRLRDALAALGALDIQTVAGTGVVARIPGLHANGPVTALRGDIDALPITEATGVPWASATPGVMHACGHDVHATWTIGAAMLLARQPALGDVMLVLQPAEEVGAGAPAVIASGALDRVRAIYGGHVDRRFFVGQVVAEPGALAASADTFSIVVHGRGAHGARPHESADPIVAASAIVTGLQTIVARRLDPAAAAVVTVGTVHGGTAPNVIPESVTLTGTLRAMLPTVRAALHQEVLQLATSIAQAYGASAQVTMDHGTPPEVNPDREAEWARQAAACSVSPASCSFGITNMAARTSRSTWNACPARSFALGARTRRRGYRGTQSAISTG